MKIIKSKINFRFFTPLLILALVAAYGCAKVDKPVRGDDESNPMVIVIDGDAPESHTDNITIEENELVTPYQKIPVLGSLFKSGLSGLDYWKAYHPQLVTGTHNPMLVVETEDEEESCLDCHDQETSCNNCHGYVGVNLITTDDE